MGNYSVLFEPLDIADIRLPNRIMMAPIGTNYCTSEGEVTGRLTAYLKARARGGAGLIITEGAYVCRNGRESSNQLGLYDDRVIPGLSELAGVIGDAGSRLFVQLNHAGRQTLPEVTGSELVAPSPIPCKIMDKEPRALETGEIEEIAEAFGEAARRAKEAGVDGVQVLAGHGHLLNQFLSPYSNHRKDHYGGSPENRMRFPLEVLSKIKAIAGRDYPVSFRISIEEFIEGGLTIQDSIAFSFRLVEEGVDMLDVSGGIYETGPVIVQPMLLPRSFFVEKAARLKNAIGGKVPVAVAGRIHDPAEADRHLSQGKVDLIAMGRPLLADPELPLKARVSRESEIRWCISCNQGCMDRMLMQKDITCLGNPLCGNEDDYELTPVQDQKKVLVIGGGPAGLQAAITAAQRGHAVTLYEKSDNLGGLLNIASMSPGKDVLKDLKGFLVNQVKLHGVEVKTGVTADLSIIEENNPDKVILAAGSIPSVPGVSGIDNEKVVLAEEILAGNREPGDKTLVVGGGMVGCETAMFAAEQGKKVILVEMLEDVAFDLGPFYKAMVMRKMEQLGIKIHASSQLIEVKDGKAILQSGEENTEIGDIDTLIIACGYEPDNRLEEVLAGKGIEYDVIGDSKEVRKMLDAIHEGFECFS